MLKFMQKEINVNYKYICETTLGIIHNNTQ